MGQHTGDAPALSVKISSFTDKGCGRGTFCSPQGLERQAEVPFTLPGELVAFLPLQKRAGKVKGRLKLIETASPDRIEPLCPHFGDCGGCQFQHMVYEQQLAFKHNLVSTIYSRTLGRQAQVNEVLAAPEEWGYRNKMEYTFSSDREGNRYLGLIRSASRGQVINLQSCYLVAPWYTEVLRVTRQWWEETGLTAYHPHRNQGTLRNLILRQSFNYGDRMIILVVSGLPEYAPHKHHLASLISYLREVAEPEEGQLSIFLRIQQTLPGVPTSFYEMLLHGADHLREKFRVTARQGGPTSDVELQVGPMAFLQPNPIQAARLYSAAMELGEIDKGTMVYDLYCGAGALGLCCAPFAKQVVGIELSPESSLDGRNNIRLNQLENMSIYTGAVRHVLATIERERNYPPPDVVFVDPPRSGLDPTARQVVASTAAERIVYVSCNPHSQANDVKLLEEQGYELDRLQPVDMFPQTYHVETIALLKRRKELHGG